MANKTGNKPISPELTKKMKEMNAQMMTFENEVVERIDYIYNRCYEIFGVRKKSNDWYLSDSENPRVTNHLDEDSIDIIPTHFVSEMVIITKDGDEWELSYSLPTRWLYEDFENELASGKKAYLSRQAMVKAAVDVEAAKKKKQKKAAIASAKKKLSADELKALGL